VAPKFTADDYNRYLVGVDDLKVFDSTGKIEMSERKLGDKLLRPEDAANDQFFLLDQLRVMKSYVQYMRLNLSSIYSATCNQILMRTSYTKVWKLSKIVRTHKKTRNYDCKDFRPIRLIPVLSKALESLMANQILLFISPKNLTGNEQLQV